jgi:hypothetical protein
MANHLQRCLSEILSARLGRGFADDDFGKHFPTGRTKIEIPYHLRDMGLGGGKSSLALFGLLACMARTADSFLNSTRFFAAIGLNRIVCPTLSTSHHIPSNKRVMA